MDLILDDEKIDRLLRDPGLTHQQRVALTGLRTIPESVRLQAIFESDKNSQYEDAEIVSETPYPKSI
jgi:hypothetical protein